MTILLQKIKRRKFTLTGEPMNTHNPATFFLRSGTTRLQQKPAVHTLGSPTRTVTSESIFRCEREIGIDHNGALYRLKVTRQGKLILNK